MFRAWVDLLEMSELLKLDDIKPNQVPLSVRDSIIIDTIGSEIVCPRQSIVIRQYLSNRLKVGVTLTNITGIPYSLPAQAVGTNEQAIVAHGDMMAFAVANAGAPLGYPAVETPGFSFEYTVDFNDCGTTLPLIRSAAIASAAFPLGLKPRALSRGRSAYNHRPIVLTGGAPQPTEVAFLEPSWPKGFTCDVAPAYPFVNFDGGCIDNSPLEWARAQFAGGLTERNDRSRDAASPAVIVIDPFPQFGQAAPVDTETGDPLHSAALTLLGVSKEHSRFSADELAIATTPNVYSRFLFAPARPEPGINGEPDSTTQVGPWIASGLWVVSQAS